MLTEKRLSAMQEKIVCVNCHNEVPANIRLKGNQQYCGAKACQNARKAQWKRNKMAADPDFAAKQKKSQQHWRKNKPAHQYQKQYRQTHPQYVENNRIKQHQRNQKRNSSIPASSSEKIVKVDASPSNDQKTNIYLMKILTPNVSPKIVKVDALIVQLIECQSITVLPP
jgi:hypothetical protein